MSYKIVLISILIFVISSVIVVGTEEVKTDWKSSKVEQDKNHIDHPQIASEAGIIEETHTGAGKSRKRPILTYVKPANESESEEKKNNSSTNTLKENVSSEVKTENKTSTTPAVDSSDHQKPLREETSTQIKTSSSTSAPISIKATTKLMSSSQKPSTITTTSTTTTTTTVATTKATTPKPIKKKPKIAINAADNPEIAQLEKKVHYMKPISIKENLVVEEPIAELSQERTVEELSNNRYMLYITLVFALPCIVLVLAMGYRKFKEYRSTREYRRVDFLVDGMYAD